jgi:putative ABC transport system permease protein
MLLGLRDLLARRARAVWLMLAVAVTGAAMVVTLSIHAALDARPAGEASDVPSELPTVIVTLDAVLALITVSALLAVALLSIRERIRDFGVLRAIGVTPGQLVASVVGAQGLLALVASVASIPAGVGLYLLLFAAATGSADQSAVLAPWWWLGLVPVAILFVTAVATAIPAKIATRIPAADAVRYE